MSLKQFSSYVREALKPSRPPPPKILAGRYLLHSKMEEGGLSNVYRATDLKMGREVALKLPKQENFNQPFMKELFSNEIRALSKIKDDKIVSILDHGLEQGQPYLAMEYVVAHTLHFYSPYFLTSLHAVLEKFSEICDAVQTVHNNGWVHMDVKPANIFVLINGSVKLFDFGFAKPIGDVTPTLTPTGGTAEFIPPESHNRDALPSPSRDIYALGGVLYFMLTHRYPLNEAGTFIPLLRREFKTDIMTEKVHTATTRALKEDPAERFSTVEQFKGSIHECLESLRRAA